MENWFDLFFDERYDELHREIEATTTAGEVAQVYKWLNLSPGMSVLDVPCGGGRHTVSLAKRGLLATGLDRSARMLARAQRLAAEHGVQVDFVRGDMRNILWQNRFDAVVNLFNSFGYFDRLGDQQALTGMVTALRPRGRLLLDLPNRDYYCGQVPPAYWTETTACWVLCSFRFDSRTGVAETDYIFVPKAGGTPDYRQTRVRWYTLPEIEALLETAGAHVEAVLGDWSGNAFDLDTPRMIVIAGKREQAAINE